MATDQATNNEMVPKELKGGATTEQDYNTLDDDDHHDFLSPEAMTTAMARGKGSTSKGDSSASLARRSDPIRPGVVGCRHSSPGVVLLKCSGSAAEDEERSDRPTVLHGD
ncbi:hypothetical protein TRIUR3_22536 [Triticum urartu]|uniref:Uncharacterized protein n=1 Tax=Triticum urartu TaxID=4572 RepID=M7Y758_TRIUA|nr:hypothetical protein TRIUR3_22536 [Triticum urartu]